MGLLLVVIVFLQGKHSKDPCMGDCGVTRFI